MKNIALILLCLAFFGANAQKITKKFLVGKWTSEGVDLEFIDGQDKEFKIIAFSKLSKNNFKVLGYQFKRGSFFLNTMHEANNWEAVAKLIFIDEDTMVADYVSEAPGQAIYNRVLSTMVD
jgi:hypothetical protein